MVPSRRRYLRPDQTSAIWKILVQYVGADSEISEECMRYMGSPAPYGHEFRFMGCLGFGGKLHFTDLKGAYISCYPEDRNRIRDAIIGAVNEELAEIAPSREILMLATIKEKP